MSPPADVRHEALWTIHEAGIVDTMLLSTRIWCGRRPRTTGNSAAQSMDECPSRSSTGRPDRAIVRPADRKP